jgi:hypothetical protein
MNNLIRLLASPRVVNRIRVQHVISVSHVSRMTTRRDVQCSFSSFSAPGGIVVQVNTSGEKIQLERDSMSCSLDKICTIAQNINKIRPAEMKEVEVREAYRVLDTLAHSMHKNDLEPKECDRRGELAWMILKRLMIEDNLFDPVERRSFANSWLSCYCGSCLVPQCDQMYGSK